MASSSALFVFSVVLLLALGCFADEDPFQNVGYINVSKERGANMFYWFFEAMNGNASAPVILWLQGGPGCSAMMGLFNENGPFKVTEDLQMVPNNNTWNLYYHMLYIDNPVGTGFSYVEDPKGYVTSEEEMGADLYAALVTFFYTKFPQYSKNDFYIFGESYAGKYIPTISSVIYQENQKGTNLINLKGVGIGDGWVDPLGQSMVYADFCYQTGLIDRAQMKIINQWQAETASAVLREDWITANNWWNNVTLQIMIWSGMINPSDIRIYGFTSYEPFDVTTAFVTQDSIRQKLGVGSTNFTMINEVVSNWLVNDSMKSVKDIIPQLLDEAKYKVLFFDGNFDYTVPIIGIEQMLYELEWSGNVGYNQATRTIWNDIYNNTSGYVRQYENLSFVTVVQAGHMAAMDQPERVLDMVVRFVEGKSFSD